MSPLPDALASRLPDIIRRARLPMARVCPPHLLIFPLFVSPPAVRLCDANLPVKPTPTTGDYMPNTRPRETVKS